jgi:mannose-1-phosphate guanylyltransferase
MNAMILAAGLGTRLRPITHEIPKPMVPVLDRPVMEHIVGLLREHGFTEVVANVSHLPEQIRGRFGDGSAHGISLTYSEESELLGTAGGVRNVAEFFGDESFLVISGDALTDIDLGALRAAHESHDGMATLSVKRVADTSQIGVVLTGSDRRVQGFQEKPDPAEALSDLGNCGIYVFRPEIFDHFPSEPFVDWAMDVFPALLERDVSFYVHEVEGYWNDIGNLDEYRQGNFDALAGKVRIDHGAGEAGEGVLAGDGARLNDAKIQPPAFIGAGAELGKGVRIEGPAVVGAGSRIGGGARLREAVLLPGTEVSAGAIIEDGLAWKDGQAIASGA